MSLEYFLCYSFLIEKYMESYDYGLWTCPIISLCLGENALADYKEFISPFIRGKVFDYKYMEEESDLRKLLLHEFLAEVALTGRYKNYWSCYGQD